MLLQYDQIGRFIGQLFKACGNNYFAQIDHIFGDFLKGSKSFIFLVKSFLGNFL